MLHDPLSRKCPHHQRCKVIKLFPQFADASTVSVDIQPTATTSTIALATVYRLGLLPDFDRYGRYTCDSSVSVPTKNGFYTSRTHLRCSHVSGESDIVLGSDWVSASGSMFYADGSRLFDPPESVIASLPTGYHWTADEGKVVCSLNMLVH